MSDLSTRQERFCQEYASGASGAEAARRAGYSIRGADVQACRLLGKARVKARVAEVQAATAKEIQWTREDHLRRLHEIGEAAERAKSYGVAARCEELRGKVLGFYAEPAETPEERPTPRDLAPTGDALLRLPSDRPTISTTCLSSGEPSSPDEELLGERKADAQVGATTH